ncbi:MAG: hypothetical protein IT330_11050 [Anaerolineae bacterium]|nr:hypothetical protein [Anaerolineae bacterium]
MSNTVEARTIFDELDWQQLAIFARYSPTRRLEIMFDLCEFVQQMTIATERQRDPQVSDAELSRRVKARIELAYGT